MYAALVPPPRVEVTKFHTSTPLYAGSALTLRCTAEVNAAVDAAYVTRFMWRKSGRVLSSNNYTSISNVTQLSSNKFEAMLVLNPLSSTLSIGTYTCQVVVSPDMSLPLLQGASQTEMEIVTVQGD